MAASATSVPNQTSSLPENPKGAVNPVPLNHVNGPIKGPPRPAQEETDPTTSEPTNTPPSSPLRKRKSTPPSDQPPSKRPRIAQGLSNVPRPQYNSRRQYKQQSVFDLVLMLRKCMIG